MEPVRTPKRDIMGVVLMIVGVMLLLRNFGAGFGLGELWPWFIILFGLALLAMVVSDRSQYVLLMPASILIVAGGVFEACVQMGWSLMGTLWPALVISPGLGFLAMYIVGPGGGMFLLPGIGLVLLGAVVLLRQSAFWRYWPVVLIGGGIYLVARSLRRTS
ncbi:MAG: hypothetical protein MUE60_06730 [Candidatus Eisenbacteria bacterium]|jgi:hypothetical protein|nr:hypothetical protein [Candidatus Eisenbacteria bacterium]